MKYVKGHVGLGDQIYMRPFMKSFGATHVATPWPELYWDMPELKCVHYTKGLRTQSLNASIALRRGQLMHEQPGMLSRSINYITHVRRRMNIMDALEVEFRCEWRDFSLPLHDTWVAEAWRIVDSLDLGGRRLALIHPPTLRRESYYPGRNPKPEYMTDLMHRYRDQLFFLSVGFVRPPHEVYDGVENGWDIAYNGGELHWTTIAALMTMASVCVTGPGFMVPLGIATKANLFTIFGGYQPSHQITHPYMDLSRYTAVEPINFCHCLQHNHECKKEILPSRLFSAFDTTLESRHGVRVR